MTTTNKNFYNYLKNEPLPKYTRGEEIFNFVSHTVGGGFGILALLICLFLSINLQLPPQAIVSLIIYGLSVIILYTTSSVYHGLKPNLISKKLLRILDHCTIYILIAGTYTPICVIAMQNTPQGMIILILQWLFCFIGIIMNAFWLNNKVVKVVSVILYCLTGWMLIFVPGSISLLTLKEFIFILIGGLSYTFGVIFYCLGSNKKWAHSIFHLFCVAATVFQFIGILLIVLGI